MLAKLELLKPHFVVVGSGAWNDIDKIAGACAPVAPLIIMRDMTENLIDQVPENVMDNMASVASRLFYKKLAAHLLNEQYNDIPRAKSWELRAITFSQLPTVALNLSYGKDPDPRFREVADVATYVGAHLYDGYEEDNKRFVDRNYTSRRYATNWLADYTYKYIATEVGIESFPGTGQRRGWRDMGLSEVAVKDRLKANAMEWYADGLLGACYFTAGHTEQSWNEGYGMTELMATAWSKLPAPRENEMITKQDLEAARLKVREEFLNVQRRHAAAKKNDSFTEMGAELESIFDLAGKGVNITDTEFEALSKKLP